MLAPVKDLSRPASVALSDIAAVVGAVAPADAAAIKLTGVNTLERSAVGEIAFLSDEAFVRKAADAKASAFLVSKDFAEVDVGGRPVLLVDDAAVAAEQVLCLFERPAHVHPGVAASAVIDTSVQLSDGTSVGPGVVVGPHCTIGRGTVLHSNVTLGRDVTLGDGCVLYPGVVIYDGCTLGKNCIVHANAVIGADGFGYRFDGKQHVKLPHVGTVEIGDDVEIGANTTIDRGKFDVTSIGSGTKIDNLCQIAHNVRIGQACILCANVGIAGTTTIGNGVFLAGGSGVRDHVTIGDGAKVAAYSAVPCDVAAGVTVTGVPAIPHREFLREQAAIRKLPGLMKQVRRFIKLGGDGSSS